MGLYKRGTVWWMSFVYKGQRFRQSTGTSSRKLAEAILAKVNHDITEGRWFDTAEEKKRTFRELLDRYLREHSIPRKAPASHVRDLSVSRHLLSFFGHLFLAEISPRKIAEYKGRRRVDGAKPATINKELGLVRHAFNLAIKEWEWCRDNPMHRVTMEPVHNQVDRWLAAKEEERLMVASPVWLREIVIFALNTGMRKGEILSLLWRDVDFSRSVLVVMKSKNRERRTLPLNSRVFELLMERQHGGATVSDFVFSTSHGTRITDRNLSRAFYVAMEKAELENFRFHDLRHTFATRLVQAGVDLYKVQRLLGHKTPAMTQRYAHHSPESLRDGVLVLDRRTSPVVSQISHSGEKPEQLPKCSGNGQSQFSHN
ncbi:MAG: tyrosine-type recombinase/integrase [Nitrospirae bacterium]|nr:tyrosine-type recombinase/integrase [Nitrospirota bacterium]